MTQPAFNPNRATCTHAARMEVRHTHVHACAFITRTQAHAIAHERMHSLTHTRTSRKEKLLIVTDMKLSWTQSSPRNNLVGKKINFCVGSVYKTLTAAQRSNTEGCSLSYGVTPANSPCIAWRNTDRYSASGLQCCLTHINKHNNFTSHWINTILTGL